MRHFLIFWLCLSLLLPAPLRAGCCLGVGQTDAAVALEDLPPCHRAQLDEPQPVSDGAGDSPAAPDAGAGDCSHCACPCRMAAMPVAWGLSVRGHIIPVPFDTVSETPRERVRIPPLPPPIALS
jgi:hypothetical protein